jgi:hypothetical protein
MILVLDANIWIKERLLRSSIGVALLYALRRSGGKLVLPDVVEKEVVHRSADMGAEAVDKIKQGFTTVQSLLGTRPDLSLPSRADFQDQARERLHEMSDLIERVDISFDQYRSAVRRVVEKKPPNTTKEQYRDTLLWEVICTYVTEGKVAFVTEDRDFFQDRKVPKGLAHELREELASAGDSVSVHTALEQFLSSLEENIARPDDGEVIPMIQEVLDERIQQHADNKGFGIGQLADAEVQAFLTEQVDLIALSFILRYEVVDIPQGDDVIIPEGVMQVKGECMYDLKEKEVREPRLERIELFALDGTMISGGMAVFYASISDKISGVRQVTYKVRKEL